LPRKRSVRRGWGGCAVIYRHGMKRPGDVILGLTAAMATASLLALIALDAIRNAYALCAAGFIFAAVSLGSLLKWLRT